VKRRIAMLCIRLGAVLCLAFLALGCDYALTRPGKPDPSAGRIYRVGRLTNPTYLTKDEVWWLCLLGCGAIPFLVAGAALGWPFSDRDYEKIRATYTQDTGSDDRA
jgi:hypothetical protein